MTDQINEAFLWPKASSSGIQQIGKPLYKPDRLLEGLEKLVTDKRAWGPVDGTTKRTESEAKLNNWITIQNTKLRRLKEAPEFAALPTIELSVSDFPNNDRTPNTRVVTTATNIAYLIDETRDFLEVLDHAFGQRTNVIASSLLNERIGTFVYVTNSVESGGRAFSGDPFTGQVAAYSRIFAHDLLGKRVLNFVAYYPHQLYSQFFSVSGEVPNNKGVKMLRSQASLIVTCGGVLLEPQNWKVD